MWFRKTQSPSIDIELAGRINVRQQPGEKMEFFGEVEPIPGRGEMNIYGRTFRLVEGTIELQGPAEATTLDVTAQYQVPTQGDPDDEEVLINVNAEGPPRQPRPRLQRRTLDAAGRHHLLHRHRPSRPRIIRWSISRAAAG